MSLLIKFLVLFLNQYFILESFMKSANLLLSILLIASLSVSGCSEKKNASPNKKVIVKKAIIKPPEENDTKKDSGISEPSPLPAAEKPAVMPAQKTEEEKIYPTKKNETLSEIAAMADVYGDPLKWILLYRYNREAFNGIGKDERFPGRQLPADIKLKVIPRGDAGKALKAGSRDHWVVNVLSSPEEIKIIPDAVTLADNGYPAYITKANVKGQDYMRLRVGFYDDKARAEDAGQKIAAILNVSDIWVTRADESEYKEFGIYK
jgi:hypothetical protein